MPYSASFIVRIFVYKWEKTRRLKITNLSHSHYSAPSPSRQPRPSPAKAPLFEHVFFANKKIRPKKGEKVVTKGENAREISPKNYGNLQITKKVSKYLLSRKIACRVKNFKFLFFSCLYFYREKIAKKKIQKFYLNFYYDET